MKSETGNDLGRTFRACKKTQQEEPRGVRGRLKEIIVDGAWALIASMYAIVTFVFVYP